MSAGDSSSGRRRDRPGRTDHHSRLCQHSSSFLSVAFPQRKGSRLSQAVRLACLFVREVEESRQRSDICQQQSGDLRDDGLRRDNDNRHALPSPNGKERVHRQRNRSGPQYRREISPHQGLDVSLQKRRRLTPRLGRPERERDNRGLRKTNREVSR